MTNRKLSSEDLEICSTINSGHFSDNYKIRFRQRNCLGHKEAIVKKVHPLTEKEVELKLVTVKHQNIVTYLGYISEPFVDLLVMEPAELTLRDYPRNFSTPEIRKQWTLELCAAVRYLHTELNEPIVHRHIASSKCLLFPQAGRTPYVLKLSDYDYFGKSWTSFKDKLLSKDILETNFAPEVRKHFAFSTASDIYALAAVLQADMRITESVLVRCWMDRPEDRPSIKKVIYLVTE